MTKKLHFKVQSVAKIISISVAGTISISMAYLGYGVWSLVAHSLTASILNMTMILYKSTWKPKCSFSYESFKSLLPFSLRLVIAGQINSIGANIQKLLIGKHFSPSILGYSSRASQTNGIISNVINRSVNRVFFSVFSSIKDDKERLIRGTRRLMKNLAFINTPIMIGMITVAKPMTIVVFTSKWLPSAPLLQIVCILGIFVPFYTINNTVLIALGHTKVNLHITSFSTISTLSILYFTIDISIQALSLIHI